MFSFFRPRRASTRLCPSLQAHSLALMWESELLVRKMSGYPIRREYFARERRVYNRAAIKPTWGTLIVSHVIACRFDSSVF